MCAQAPPPELNFLTAANAMAEDVVVLPDVCKVRRVVVVVVRKKKLKKKWT